MQFNQIYCSFIRLLCLYHYHKKGETLDGIKVLEALSCKIFNNSDLAATLKELKLSNQGHRVKRLIDTPTFKLTAHSIPRYFQIPRHTHRDFFSITYLHQGAVKIKQASITSTDEGFERLLKPQQSCAGLLNLRNIHSICSLDTRSVFLSLRIAKPRSPFNAFKSFYYPLKYRYALLPGLAILLSSTFSPSLLATDNQDQFIKASSTNTTRVKQQLELANQLRTGKGRIKDYYQAAQLYKKASQQGNAEAQYWLGVMCFDGLGITDDRDDAMHWLALSSDQNYLPATKLLHHLLETDDVSDC